MTERMWWWHYFAFIIIIWFVGLVAVGFVTAVFATSCFVLGATHAAMLYRIKEREDATR